MGKYLGAHRLIPLSRFVHPSYKGINLILSHEEQPAYKPLTKWDEPPSTTINDM